MRFRNRALTGCLVAVSVVVLAACGSSSSTSSSAGASSSSSGKTIDIYSSLPLLGPLSADTIPALNGEKLALSEAGNKAG
ncbi:MAG TPA: hypothetical protein VE983_10825, partial [Solirubrobacteraceae bacterium]|nr:hypothetical protein [Solirubrobacteraceae bacterium]